ncbi:leucine--tRNA ligase [bacterium]|nr:leucine--tRNA ligase [bacterium]
MNNYEPQRIEKKWQEIWQNTNLYKTDEASKKPKFYALDMFPYPSGEGLHVGHPKGYIATDVFSRLKTLQGFRVLHPMGWDAFGLPAENYAIKNKVHPKKAVEKNIKRFKEQLSTLGFSYDWDREVNTTDPEYYKWTQWIFLKLFEKGLAYESSEPINWCPSCKTGLANEDLEDGKCERCGSDIEKKPMRQWVLKMTEYADKLLYDLDKENLDWEEQIKEQQRNWIGRSEGTEVDFKVKDSSEKLKIFTTRIDTIFGATYMVVAPEHVLIQKLKNKIQNFDVIEKYIKQAQKKSDLERTDIQKEKSGVEIKGIKAINPFNKEEIPVFIADYIIGGYGTGAIMAVPAHDERDFEFAKKYNVPVKEVIAPYWLDENYPPQQDKETEKREVVAIIVKNPKTGKFLVLKWKKTGWQSFPTGGLDGEDLETAARREILEETGYKNLKFIKQIPGSTYVEFYRPHKGSNVYAHFHYVLFELENEERQEIEKAEKDLHEVLWIDEKNIVSFINVGNQIFAWNRLKDSNEIYIDYGILVGSGEYSGLNSEEAKEKMIEWLSKESLGKKKVNYKMRDWVFSRQRYWGEPIPIIHCDKCGTVGVPEKELPVLLPEVEKYEPTGTGESPLAAITQWVNTKCPKCGGSAKRETNTMPQWAGSCWYYLRYIDPNNKKALVDKNKEKEWMSVDLYVGGIEHATRHLLYARFWHKFLYDIGVITTNEPFKRLIHVGLIAGEDGRKMSKRWGNVINPDDVVSEFGADALRLYEMFMGPFMQEVAWSTKGLKGTKKFLDKVWNLSLEVAEVCSDIDAEDIIYSSQEIEETALIRTVQKTVKKVEDDILNFRFNTAVSAMMECMNEMIKIKRSLSVKVSPAIWKNAISQFIIILSPFSPHLAEEIWSKLGHVGSIFKQSWPVIDKNLIKEDLVSIAVQVNGKVRGSIEIEQGASEDSVVTLAKVVKNVKVYLDNKEIIKVIFVKDKIISFIVK